MATDLIITSEKLNELKTKVRNEMKRRGATEHSASLSQYGGSSWDYSNTPKAGSPIIDEHVQKIIDPLLHVNDFLYDNSLKANQSGIEMSIDRAEKFVDSLAKISSTNTNSGCRGLHVNDFLYDNSLKANQSGIEMSIDRAEKFVDSLAKISSTNTNSGCRGSCMGLCSEACTGECTGCSSCSGGCSTSCGKSCSSNCGGGCSGCTGGCHTGCSNTCGSGCQTSLRY